MWTKQAPCSASRKKPPSEKAEKTPQAIPDHARRHQGRSGAAPDAAIAKKSPEAADGCTPKGRSDPAHRSAADALRRPPKPTGSRRAQRISMRPS